MGCEDVGRLRTTARTHLHLCVLELRLALRKMRHVLVCERTRRDVL